MTCEHCETARARTWGQYDSHCRGCRARSCARSMVAYAALVRPADQNARVALMQQALRMLPGVEPEEARRMVLDWWEQDHPEGITA